MRSAAEDLSCLFNPSWRYQGSLPHNPSLLQPQQPERYISTYILVVTVLTHIELPRSRKRQLTTPALARETEWLRWRKVYRRFHHVKGRDPNTGSSTCRGKLLQQRLQALCRHYALDKGRSCSTASEANCKIIHTTPTSQHTLLRHPGPSPLHTLAIMGQNETMLPWLVAACTEPQHLSSL